MKGNIYNIAKLPKKLILLIGLSTPLSRVIIFVAVLVAFIVTPTQDLKYWPIRSLYESLFNLKLYSWGMTRSISMILHGEFSSAWELNNLSYLVVGITLFLFIKDMGYLLKKKDFTL